MPVGDDAACGSIDRFRTCPFHVNSFWVGDKSGQDILSSQTHGRNVLSDHQIPRREGKESRSAEDQMIMIYETVVARRWLDSVDAKPNSGTD